MKTLMKFTNMNRIISLLKFIKKGHLKKIAFPRIINLYYGN